VIAREEVIERFLAGAGWAGARRRVMGADWSSRRYERLDMNGERAILMDAPGPAAAQVPTFMRIADLLRGVGLSAPRLFAASARDGLLLLEDFGDETHAALLEAGEPAEPLYLGAVSVLIRLHQALPEPPADLPRFDVARFRDQVMLFADAYMPAALGRPLPDPAREQLAAAWDAVLPQAFGVPDRLLLRDFHPGNLMRLAGRRGVAAVGLLDFQDAGIGPVSYDLVSLLQDARRDVPDGIVQVMTRLYLDAFPGLDRDAFHRSSAVMAAVRHARIIGRVAELAAGGMARQLDFMPRVWGQLERCLADPALAPVRDWIETHLPADRGLHRVMGHAA
jgi:aminoglycoside/choline kinase family phosphotransferase